MKTLKTLTTAVCTMLMITASAQQFGGKAVYLENYTQRAKNVLSSAEAQLSQLSPEQRIAIMQAIENEAKREMELLFNNEASVYAAPDRIELNTTQENTGMEIEVKAEGTMAYYCNIKTGKTITQEILSDREFLVEDKMETYEWQLHPESKTIGRYRVNKATTVKDSVSVTAWYSSEIPVSLGPRGFNGLPGLILEISTDDSQITFQDIVLNDKSVAVQPPKKGKKISAAKFKELEEKRKKEDSVKVIKEEKL